MTIEDLIDRFVDDLGFYTMLAWADVLGVEHNENQWLDDEWPEKENELRVSVAEAMKKIGQGGRDEKDDS